MEKHKTWLMFNHMEATIMEALDMLNELVDESDPDLDLPNIVHAFQTAERIREEHPDKEWFQLVGLIHDLGMIMAFYGEPQWAVVGDTFPVGCKPQPSIVFGEESFQNNPDTYDSRYNTKLGIYKEGCGIENVIMSWGHDEYLYHVLMNHMAKMGTSIPEGGLWAIRFHSCYQTRSNNVCNTDNGDGKDHTDVHFVLKNDVLLGAEEGAEAQGEDVSTSHAGLGGKE